MTDQPTYRLYDIRTDMTKYRAAISAKKNLSYFPPNFDKMLGNFLTFFLVGLLSRIVMVFWVFGQKLPLSMVSLTASRYSTATTMIVMMVVNFATPLSIVS